MGERYTIIEDQKPEAPVDVPAKDSTPADTAQASSDTPQGRYSIVPDSPNDSQGQISSQDKPSIASEAGKIALQAADGASQGLLDVGNKPFSELAAGEVGSKLNEGVLIGQKIRAASSKDIAETIKKFSMSGVQGIADAMQVDQGATLHSKYGFPSLPQPETGIGKALGMVAKIAGQAVAFAPFEGSLSPSSNVKLPKVEQINSAMAKIDQNVSTIKDTNAENLFRTQDGIDTNNITQKIKDTETLSKLETDKTKLADSVAREIQGKPGEKGLAVKASQKLGQDYYKEYSKYSSKPVHMDDVQDGTSQLLQQYGIIDGKGEMVPDAKINEPQAKVLEFYKELKSNEADGKTPKYGKSITAGELDSKFKDVLGKGRQYGSEEHILTDFRYIISDFLPEEMKAVKTQFAPDFQLRNAAYDRFHVFDRIGFRRGSGDQTSGTNLLHNVSHEDPAMIDPHNERIMDFLKRYGGKDPSEPVKQVGKQIVNVKQAAQTRAIGSQVLLQNMKRDIFNTNLKAEQSAAELKDGLDRLKVSAQIKEAKDLKAKNIKTYAATAAGTLGIGHLATGLIKKVID